MHPIDIKITDENLAHMSHVLAPTKISNIALEIIHVAHAGLALFNIPINTQMSKPAWFGEAVEVPTIKYICAEEPPSPTLDEYDFI